MKRWDKGNACKLTLLTKQETKKVYFAKLETSMQTCKIKANQLTRLKILQNCKQRSNLTKIEHIARIVNKIN